MHVASIKIIQITVMPVRTVNILDQLVSLADAWPLDVVDGFPRRLVSWVRPEEEYR